MENVGGTVCWTDVQATFPDMCEIECRVFLNRHVVCIETTMVEAGLEEIKALGEAD